MIRLILAVVLVATVGQNLVAKGPGLERPDPHGIIEWTRKVYSNGKWNGSPDIAHWKGNYYVVVNQGSVHPGTDGPAIVLRSSNLNKWEQIHTTNGSAVDCKLLALPSRLIFYYLYMKRQGDPLSVQKPDAGNYVETRAIYTDDGENWSKPKRMYHRLHNFWRPKIFHGVVYVASDTIDVGRSTYLTRAEEQNYRLYRVDLLSSTDGLHWKKVSTLLKGNPHFPITEVELVFRPDGQMWAFTRQNIFSRSLPPYLHWTNQPAGIMGGGIGGPSMIAVGNDVFLAGRFYGYLKNHGPPESPQTNKIATSLWKHAKATDKFERIADLPKPAYADMGYNGFVATQDGIFVLYYSGHAHGETAEARSTKADIYIAKLKLGIPADTIK